VLEQSMPLRTSIQIMLSRQLKWFQSLYMVGETARQGKFGIHILKFHRLKLFH
jgi:hypothetical protein